MKEIMEKAGIGNPDKVVVTGYSAGELATALLSDDIYTNYFPNAKSKNVLVDASLLLNNDWHSIATNVWQTPKSISDKLTTNNLTLDCLKALNEKYGDNTAQNILDNCYVWNYLKTSNEVTAEKISKKLRKLYYNKLE